MGQGEKVSLGGAAITIVAAFLPWITLGALGSVSGIDGDGTFTLIMGAIVAGIVVAREWENVDQLATLALGVLVAGIGLMYVTDPAAGIDTGSEFGNQIVSEVVSPAVGVYLTLIGGVAITAGGALGYFGDDTETQPTQPAD